MIKVLGHQFASRRDRNIHESYSNENSQSIGNTIEVNADKIVKQSQKVHSDLDSRNTYLITSDQPVIIGKEEDDESEEQQ